MSKAIHSNITNSGNSSAAAVVCEAPREGGPAIEPVQPLNLTRRNIMNIVAAMSSLSLATPLAAPAADASGHPDATLVDLCSRFSDVSLQLCQIVRLSVRH